MSLEILSSMASSQRTDGATDGAGQHSGTTVTRLSGKELCGGEIYMCFLCNCYIYIQV